MLVEKILKQLQQFTCRLNLETTKVIAHRINPGWFGKINGYIQVLWEQGWIYFRRLGEYKIRKEDSYGALIPEFSLLHMIDTCPGFANEVFQIDHVAQSLGARVIITPKYHAVYTG